LEWGNKVGEDTNLDWKLLDKIIKIKIFKTHRNIENTSRFKC
jgi:hypothetical protein